jgi:predicted DNA-binding protein
MPVHLNPEMEKKLEELAARTGRPAGELVEDAMAGYLAELTNVREMLDRRHDDLKSGRVQPMDGEEALARLRERSARRRNRPI